MYVGELGQAPLFTPSVRLQKPAVSFGSGSRDQAARVYISAEHEKGQVRGPSAVCVALVLLSHHALPCLHLSRAHVCRWATTVLDLNMRPVPPLASSPPSHAAPQQPFLVLHACQSATQMQCLGRAPTMPDGSSSCASGEAVRRGCSRWMA